MKTYELIQRQRLYIDMVELVVDIIEYLATEYGPENYDQIGTTNVECAIEYAVDCQDSNVLCGDYENLREILSDIAYDVVDYINTHNIQHELLPIIKHNIV